EISSVRDADRVSGLLVHEVMEAPSLIINRIRNHVMKHGDMLDIDEIVQILSIDLIGIVRDDDVVIRSSNQGARYAFQLKTSPSIAYRNTARRMLAETVPLQSLEENAGMFQKLKKFFGMRT